MKISDHNQKVLERFASMMIDRMTQMKNAKWKKGWIGTAFGGGPMNIEGRCYSGGNAFFLCLLSAMKKYKYPVFCTLKQANKLGAHINKGAESMPVLFWEICYKMADGQRITADEYRSLSVVQQKDYEFRPVLKSYNVFNVQDTNLDEKHPEKLKALTSKFKSEKSKDVDGMYKNDSIDKLLLEQSWICPIQYKLPSDVACFSPLNDVIIVPMKAQFKTGTTKKAIYADGQEFYSSLIHEMIHSTGTKERLNRYADSRPGSKLYGKEELVAELGAARIGQELGFDKRILDNNSCYLDSWIKILQEKPEFILTVMGDVDKSSRMILDRLSA